MSPGTDPYTELRPGDTGTVVFVDSLGTIHVNWDGESKLGMIPGHDRIEKVDRGT